MELLEHEHQRHAGGALAEPGEPPGPAGADDDLCLNPLLPAPATPNSLASTPKKQFPISYPSDAMKRKVAEPILVAIDLSDIQFISR